MWIDEQILEQYEKQVALKCFFPKKTTVVLGRSQTAEIECNTAQAGEDGVPILKRCGGGGAVVLYPGSWVVSIGTWVKDYFCNDRYFKKINQAVIDSLESLSPELKQKMAQNGISDLVIGDRKFAGTSMFRSRNYLLYQASVIVDLDLEAVGRYLRHPSREPEYRLGRDHSSFLTGLSSEDPQLKQKIAADWQNTTQLMQNKLNQNLADELIHPVELQFEALRKKLAREKTEN